MSWRALCLAGVALFATACSTGRSDDYLPHPAAPNLYASAPPYRYRIGAGDELALRFIVSPDLNAPVVVGPDGSAVFPLISSFPVAGLTLAQLNDVLTRRYSAVLRNPQVQVLVTTYGSAQIYVAGEVRQAGVFNLKGQLTVAQAIATAGGLLDTARSGKVVLLRQRAGQARPLVRVIDLDTLFRQGLDNDPGPVLPGDLIFVPKSKVAEVDLVVDQYINRTLPFSRNIGYEFGNGRF